jgi:hypothetical protein
MRGKAELVAYCGIYCGDCLGYTGVIADAAETFAAVLDRYQFERTAAWIFLSSRGSSGLIWQRATGRPPTWAWRR